jgi:cytosine/adenosine deaminase-related metal-dependent hydrolase
MKNKDRLSRNSNILIKDGTIITMDQYRQVISNGAVIIQNDKILDIGPTQEIIEKYSSDIIIDASNKIVMPGLFDGHCHAGHSLLRSLGMHNKTWYKACQEIYSKASSLEYWEADSELLNLERLKFGTTCGLTFFGGGDCIMRVDDPKYAKKHCDAALQIGIRTYLAVGSRRPPFPSKFSEWNGSSRFDYEVSFEDQLKVCEKIIQNNNGRAYGRINIAMMHPTPHPEINPIKGKELDILKQRTNETYRLTEKYDLLFSMDGHTKGTIKFCHKELKLTGSNSLFSHSTELTSEEINICAKTGTKVVHNPSAIASMIGRCPVPELLDAGAVVSLGSDAGAPDRSFDMFRHMFQCMRYHRRHFKDSNILPPGKVLEMTTIDSAMAFGIGDIVGSLEIGKKADIILLDAYRPHLFPFNMPVDRVAYFANGNDVDTVIVDGKILMENREIKTIDEKSVLDKAQEEIKSAVGRSGLKKLFDTTDRYWGHSRY